MSQNQKAKSRHFIYVESRADQDLPQVIAALPEALQLDLILHENTKTQRQLMPLGETRKGLIYNIWSGFHPDTFAALAGCIAEGGWVILTGPPLHKLHLFQDPNYDKISSWPHICPTNASYLKMLQASLQALASSKQLQVYDQTTDLSRLILELSTASDTSKADFTATEEQAKIITHILQNQTWGTLFANRGFGKTTCLKLLMQKLAEPNRLSYEVIYVTERQDNRKAIAHWADSIGLTLKTATLSGLQQWKVKPALIMIDECAAYNVALLEKSLAHFNHSEISVILATSLDGYEGSARNLNKLKSPQPLKHFTLSHPMRWQADDALDQWIKRFFHAETMNALAIKHQSQQKPDQLEVSQFKPCLEQLHLSELEKQLGQWMSLMSLAHYRTRPSDTRLMLDAPHQYFWQIKSGDSVIAGLWVSLEGPIASYLHKPILERKRRVKGHLAPQYLAINGQPDALNQQWVRIVRIAVKPEFQQQGLGKQLLNTCMAHFNGLPFAVSFKADKQVKAFWDSAGFTEVKAGFHTLNRL